MTEPLSVVAPTGVDEMKLFIPVHRRTYLMSPEDGEAWAEAADLENFRIAKRGDRPVGGMTLRPMGQWFGGRAVTMTGISAVGVEPAERARGTGTAFMRAVLEQLHAARVPLSTLYPATQTIYRRCGYELAGDYIRYRVRTDDIDVRDRTLDIDLTTDRDEIAALYGEAAGRTSGLLDRSEPMWKRVFEPWKSESDAYLVRGPDGPEGYVVYSRSPGDHTRGRISAEVVALTRRAAKRILTFVADHRSFIEHFDWTGSPAEPLRVFLAEPRIDVRRSWPWMIRLVDVQLALRERGYPQAVEGELHVSIRDDVLPANDGAFVLSVAGGKADVAPGGDGALRIDVRGLAPLYTGYLSAHELVTTGYVDGPDDVLHTADAIFAGPAPWLADFF